MRPPFGNLGLHHFSFVFFIFAETNLDVVERNQPHRVTSSSLDAQIHILEFILAYFISTENPMDNPMDNPMQNQMKDSSQIHPRIQRTHINYK